MTVKYLPLLLTLTLLVFSSCRQENGSPVRNVRFDPNLLNQARDGSSCASYNYFYGDKEVNLGTVFTRKVLVAFAAGTTYDEQKSAMDKYGFVRGISNQTSSGSDMLFTVSLIDGLNCGGTEEALRILSNEAIVTYAAPYFMQQANLLGMSNEAIVTVTDGNRTVLESLLQPYGASIVNSLGNNMFMVKVDKHSEGNALELANYLKGQAGIVHAEPDFVISDAASRPAPSLRKVTGTIRE